MTFVEFGKAFLNFPGTVVGGITGFFIGSHTVQTVNGNEVVDTDGNPQYVMARDTSANLHPVTNVSVVGAISRFFAEIGSFINRHKVAISVAFWASLILSGGAALGLYLAPAALAAVVDFTIAGFSIAGVVGTGLWAQLGAVAGLTAAITTVSVFASTAIGYGISALSSLWSSKNPATPAPTATAKADATKGSATALSGLGASAGNAQSNVPKSTTSAATAAAAASHSHDDDEDEDDEEDLSVRMAK